MNDTKTLKRTPDSPPRLGGLLFPILVFVGIDLGLLGLALVLQFTPLQANYPQTSGSPVPYRSAPIPAVVLPTRAASTTAHSAPVASVTHRQTAPALRVSPTARKPSATPTAVPSLSPSVVATKTVQPSPSNPSASGSD